MSSAPKTADASSLVDGHPTLCIAGGEHEPTEDTDGRYCRKCKMDMPAKDNKSKKKSRSKKQAQPPEPAGLSPVIEGTVEDETEPQPQKRSKKLITGKLAIERDPRVYRTTISRTPPGYKRVLGLDLGTNCGVAFSDFVPGCMIKSANLVLGQWSLVIGPYDSGPLRHVRLKQFLSILEPDLIFYEEVKYDPPRALIEQRKLSFNAVLARVATASEFLGALKGTLTTWAEERNIPCQGVPIAQIKAWLVGGRANKEAMIQAANARFGINLEVEDYENSGADNIADAAAVCGMAVELYADGLSGAPPVSRLQDEPTDST